ncbi:hypothetical protein AQUCO_06100036v1 [Aquilegia coerulea]|uniref:Mediator of RNA polymerase II transcription subunit 13 n=1 Tax=Aquilegia coerulea TaxID=218851 RepID=A0A2G5CD98_AQUCA|nr:hypothetical protein AQUCO_06100036v1 [Aquilegia coerulea]
MWTNVFKIGGLHQISWFQFLPSESDLNPLPDKSVKAEQKDAATLLVLLSHLQLQKEGFLSTWTNSFVGPWDPSQGMHNPDEKIKLWLFIPGRHSSVLETAQSAVSRLRVVGSGLWVAPGDSEEVAVALSQALRNCIERALRGISYMRYGDVFTRCYPFSQSGKQSRRVQPTVEFIFAATEEALFVHVIISAKHIRSLSRDDMEKILRRCSPRKHGERLPVIVAPHGMRGQLSGCCPSDLVKQVYLSSSKVKASNGFTVVNIPSNVAQASGCQLRGQNCHVEVTLGCPGTGDKAVHLNSNFIWNKPNHHSTESPMVALDRDDQKHGSTDYYRVSERTFIYPAEAVVVPVMQTTFARSSLKRFWLQNWAGAALFGSCFLTNCSGFGRVGSSESMYQPWIDSNGIRSQNSSSNSNNSSVSGITGSSSGSDYQMISGAGDLEADADSFTCRQSGLSSNDQLENDDNKQVCKRARKGTSESFNGAGTVLNTDIEVKTSIVGAVNDQVGSLWDWDAEERVELDIQILLSDFGDFGDFFPPGTDESQAIVYSVLDCGDVNGSPCAGAMDVTDQMLLPALEFPSFDSINPLPLVVTDESQSKQQELEKDTWSSALGSYSSALSAGEFDTLSKAEAMMTFAPEYTAVEAPPNELLAQTFRSPYLPVSRKVERSNFSSSAYAYGATPPSSCLTFPDQNPSMSQNIKTCPAGLESSHAMNYKKCYTHVTMEKEIDGKLIDCNNNIASSEGLRPSSSFSGYNSINTVKSLKRKRAEENTEPRNILLSLEIVIASEVECIMFQASMCRIRHMPSLSSNLLSSVPSNFTGNSALEHPRGDNLTISDKTSSRYDVKKKESIPVRIAGDVDVGMLDGSFNAPVGVWRSVGVPKGAKPTSSSSIDNAPSFHNNSFNEESRHMYGQRQPLQELLNAMTLLVQQATSFVDVALDAEYGDGPFGWLALEEQSRRGFSCGPSMVHAGCGGVLATCHSLDIAGVELLDPLSSNVHASSVISLLHSDIKVALKSAFGNLDGPLLVTDWCKGRNQLSDTGNPNDVYSGESATGDAKDSLSAVTLAAGEPMSPTNSSGGSSCLKDGVRVDETTQRRLNQEIGSSESDQQLNSSRLRPTLLLLPMPAILVGYQDDWLKTSTSSLQLWEKAPLEPYAAPKPTTYYVVCPDIDPLASAAADFFQQLGTVYETCKLGTHTPQNMGAQTDLLSGKWASSGFVMIDCPQSMKMESGKASIMGSISDYLLALSNAWDVRSFLKSLSNVIKALRLGPNSTTNPKEGSSGPGMVIYVVCPFPEPVAVLQTVIESSTALGSTIVSSDKERRSLLHNQVARALSCSVAVDEASLSNILTISGFSIPKLVLQIVTVEAILRVTSPALNELVLLKEIAFTVYNKSRRLARVSNNDVVQSPGVSVRPQSTMMHMASPISGMWKDCIAPRITGSLPREGELDTSLRGGTWENSWQAARTGGLSCDQNRLGDKICQDDVRYLFEPLFVLAEPGSVEQGVSPMMVSNAMVDSPRPAVDDGSSGGFVQCSTSVGADIGPSSLHEGSESDGCGHSHPKTTSLHCCYGWTEDWRWLVCVWTDSRGEFLDSQIFPFGGIGSRQDTKGLQCLFVQVLHQGCQILSCSSPDAGSIKPRDIIITRIGSFYELERQEWQKAIYLVGGNEVKKWPLQLRRSVPDGISASNGNSLHQQGMSLIQDRTLSSSPNPSMYSPQTKASGYIKGGLGQMNARKTGGQAAVDNSRGLFLWVRSISLIGVSVDHSLHLILQADTPLSGGGAQGAAATGPVGYLEGFSPVKSLGSTSASYILIPSPSMHFLPPKPLQLPTCLTSDSPPLAHLLHSKGSAIPLSTGFVVSKAVPSIQKDTRSSMKEEWPSILSVSLVDYYGSSNIPQEKIARGSIKHARSINSDARDHEIETHLILESVAAELHALSWMTASPAYLERRTALPFHCDMILRLRRLIHYADKEICQKPDKVQM